MKGDDGEHRNGAKPADIFAVAGNHAASPSITLTVPGNDGA
jgi:hypothetical protein